MLLNPLQGNLPRVELGVRLTTSDCRRLELDVADRKVEMHFLRHRRVALLRDHEFQTGHGSTYRSVCNFFEALTQAW
eukprot:5114259-Pyramimonas_sp.AAC.1